MKKMLGLLAKANTNTLTNLTNPTNNEWKKKREERQTKFCETPVCKHCGKKHLSKAESKFWELDKNAASCPPSWKLTKSTWGCVGSQVGTEVWQPGKVLSNKIESNQTYLVAVQTTGPHFNWTTLKQTTRPRRSTKSTTHSSIQHQKSIIGKGKWL